MLLEKDAVGIVQSMIRHYSAAAEDDRIDLMEWAESGESELPDDLCASVRRLIDICQLLSQEKTDVLKTHYGVREDIITSLHAYDGDMGVLKQIKKDLRIKGQPPRRMYISDLHFYHSSLNRQMDCRGFSGHEEMNEYMIAQWNKKVRGKDEVFILGDFSIAKGEATNRILQQLKGRKYLITGNHDAFTEDKTFDTSLLKWVRPYAEIRDAGRKVVLSHYPIFCYNGQYRRDGDEQPLTYMLYGHVHNTYDEALVDRFIKETRASMRKSRYDEEAKPIPCQMINCFCMYSDYQPLTLDEWIELDEKRRSTIQYDTMP